MEYFDLDLQWPRDSLFLHGFVHDLLYYRYHWHKDEYELNILLHGCQDYCYGNGTSVLSEDDVILVGPGIGHASFAQHPDTYALVIRFDSTAFKSLVKKGYRFEFPDCRSTEETRYTEPYRLIRFYAAQILDAARTGEPCAQLRAKGAMEMLLVTLCTHFQPKLVETVSEKDEQQQHTIQRLTQYMQQHYAEKLTLEDLARVGQYNRTYISTLFKSTMGINFHEYLTQLRFQNALRDLATTDQNLTQIAINNGFSDLKSFNKLFKSILKRTPAEYRAQLGPENVRKRQDQRIYRAVTDPAVCAKLDEYMRFPQ